MGAERLGQSLAIMLDRRQALAGFGVALVSIFANLFRMAAPLPSGFAYYCCNLCRPHSETCQGECSGYLYWWRCPYMRWTFLCVECFTGDNGDCWGCEKAVCSYYVQES